MGVLAMIVYLGCYTDTAHPNGLKALELDQATGAMSVRAESPFSNAIYQALSPDGKYLYSCTGEGLASFKVKGQADSQHILEQVDSVRLGNCVCHVAVMPDGKQVVFADYLGGFAGSIEVENGRFGKVVKHQHSGSGPNLPRQDKAHCHQAIPTPDGKGYCVVDLGLDQIVEYPSGRVFHTTPTGAGPRHLIFHPNGRLAFLVSELGNLVSSLSWSSETGFTLIDTQSTLIDFSCKEGKEADQGKNSIAAAIRFTPDMKRVVVSNRGENSLAVFDFDESTGKLVFKARTMLTGNWPRDFIFATDSLALVACERSGEVLALNYAKDTGKFEKIAVLSGLYRPVSLCKMQKAVRIIVR